MPGKSGQIYSKGKWVPAKGGGGFREMGMDEEFEGRRVGPERGEDRVPGELADQAGLPRDFQISSIYEAPNGTLALEGRRYNRQSGYWEGARYVSTSSAGQGQFRQIADAVNGAQNRRAAANARAIAFMDRREKGASRRVGR